MSGDTKDLSLRRTEAKRRRREWIAVAIATVTLVAFVDGADGAAAAHRSYLARLQPGGDPAVRPELPAARADAVSGRPQPRQGDFRASPRSDGLAAAGAAGGRLYRGRDRAERLSALRFGGVSARRHRELVQPPIRARARRFARNCASLLPQLGEQRDPFRKGAGQGDFSRQAARARQARSAAST